MELQKITTKVEMDFKAYAEYFDKILPDKWICRDSSNYQTKVYLSMALLSCIVSNYQEASIHINRLEKCINEKGRMDVVYSKEHYDNIRLFIIMLKDYYKENNIDWVK